jgi:hypothetical protein
MSVLLLFLIIPFLFLVILILLRLLPFSSSPRPSLALLFLHPLLLPRLSFLSSSYFLLSLSLPLFYLILLSSSPLPYFTSAVFSFLFSSTFALVFSYSSFVPLSILLA